METTLKETAIDAALDYLEAAATTEEILKVDVDASINKMKATLEGVKKDLLLKKVELDLQAETDLVPVTVITDDENLKDVRKLISGASKSIKEVSDMRLNTTRPIDNFKTELIGVEREITKKLSSEGGRVKILCDNYEIAEAKKRQEERERQQRILDVQKETEKVLVLIRAEANIKLGRFINQVAEQLRAGFAKITLESFDEQIALFRSFKPVLKFEIYESFFFISPSQYNTSLLTMDEVIKLTSRVRGEMPITALQQEYQVGLAPVLAEIADAIPSKKQNLLDLAELAKINKDAAERLEKSRLETQATEQKNRQEQQTKLESEQRQTASANANKAELETHLNAQKGFQSTGPVSIKRSLIKATVISRSAYRELVEFYLRTGGDEVKLEFLADFAAKNGQPKIEGVTYNV